MKGSLEMGTPVWLLTDTLEPRGSTSYTLRLGLGLPEHGFDPLIICQSAEKVPATLRQQLTIIEAPRLENRLMRTMLPQVWRRQFPVAAPAIIHAQRRGLDDLAIDLVDRYDCPYLITVHDFIAPGESLSVLPRRLGAIIAVSPSVKRDLIANASVPSALVHDIPSGVEVSLIPKLIAPRDETKIPIVGTACALEPEKGLTYFLMAAELILSSGHDIEFVIAGSGPEEDTLRRMAQHLDIANRVTFVPYVREYGEVLESLDLFVLPSLEQGLGTVMLEAMAAGKPVVATQVGGIADYLVDGTHALLVPRANHVALAEKIQYLLDNPEKARRLASAGQQLVRMQFSVERMVLQTAALYREVIAHKEEAPLSHADASFLEE
ncbi:MAG: glycosyltransferase family 4 protein [Planctomycetota bacterium]